MTPKEKIQAVIEAQVKGGFDENEFAIEQGFKIEGEYCIVIPGNMLVATHILELLLDPEGLRAVYGEVERIDHGDGLRMDIFNPPFWRRAANRILDAWLSGGAEAAIDTAYSLLPKP